MSVYIFLTMQIEDGFSTSVELVNNLNAALKKNLGSDFSSTRKLLIDIYMYVQMEIEVA